MGSFPDLEIDWREFITEEEALSGTLFTCIEGEYLFTDRGFEYLQWLAHFDGSPGRLW